MRGVLLVTSFEISRIATVVLQRTYYERFWRWHKWFVYCPPLSLYD